jgi:hypothetical protein
MSGDARSVGPLSVTFAEGNDDPLNAAVVGTRLGQASITPGTLNAIWDNTATTGIHNVLGTPSQTRDVMIPIGIAAAPAAGDPVFFGQFRQDDFTVTPEETPSAATVKFGQFAADGDTKAYSQAWGVLLHANEAETAASTDIGIDMGAGSTYGGVGMIQVFAGSSAGGLATLSIQDATTNEDADFTELVTTGEIDVSTPGAYLLPLGTSATVQQFLRWQVSLNTATSVTFAAAFIRGKSR